LKRPLGEEDWVPPIKMGKFPQSSSSRGPYSENLKALKIWINSREDYSSKYFGPRLPNSGFRRIEGLE